MQRPSAVQAACLLLAGVVPVAGACGSRISGSASDDQLVCTNGTVVGRQSPDVTSDGATTPEAAVNSALLTGERAESSSESTEDQTVLVLARTNDAVTATFKTWNPEGRGWFVVESARCSD